MLTASLEAQGCDKFRRLGAVLFTLHKTSLNTGLVPKTSYVVLSHEPETWFLQGMQGRFSGRLETKNDEKLLVEECKLVGPLLGGAGKRGDKTRQTLAKIVRGIAAGDIRQHCEAREAHIQVLCRCGHLLLCSELCSDS